MNKEDIIKMAREAGAIPIHKDYSQKALVGNENIERFAALVAAAEREACAKVCDDIFRHWIQTDPDEKFATPDADDCARAIRERGEMNNG